MTRRCRWAWALGLAAGLGAGGASYGADAPATTEPEAKRPLPDRFKAEVVPFLARHCYTCHSGDKPKADLTLDKYRDERSVQSDRDLWENVIDMVRTGEMPPKKRPRPDAAEIDQALDAVQAVLETLDCNRPREVGRVTLRRLNRVEYNNTIRDLVGVDFHPAADFPEDDVGYGFDNIGDVLSVSPLLLERYLLAAESVLDQAIVIDDPPKPGEVRFGNLRALRGTGEARRGFGAFLHSKGSIFAQNFVEEGDYKVRIEVYADQAGNEPVKAALRVSGDVVKEFEVQGTAAKLMTVETKVRLKTGTRTISVSFLNPYREPNFDDPENPERRLYVRRIVAEGPFNPPPPVLPESHKRLMAHRPGLAPREAAREIVTRFATLAFRRPVKPEEVEKVLALYDRAEKEGQRFEERIRLALARVLVSPHFLFRVELDPPDAKPGTSYPVSEYELASRLSYFLWSSMPDAELFALAEKGRLRAELEPQVKRMLRDPKSAAFIREFAGQWLTIRKLATVTPDPKTFPNFDEALRAAMVRETELFFESIVREDRSILDLIDADYSFVNERLAKHYGIAGVKGKEFRQVKLPANRGGILTQASILTLTSNPTRTSPVKRGKWVLDQILNTPPPPPPPDVPPFPEEKQLTGSLRQVMEMHRQNTMCASCHQRMDPIGFAFENYDAIGAWREKDGKFPIDPSGVLPNGRTFQGPGELKAILKGQKDRFSRCLTEKVLTYALGRGLEYYDRCAVDAILKSLDQSQQRFSTLLMGIVTSEPFQMRTASGATP